MLKLNCNIVGNYDKNPMFLINIIYQLSVPAVYTMLVVTYIYIIMECCSLVAIKCKKCLKKKTKN